MLSVETRKKYFKYLGYTYNKEGILKFQKKYFFNKKDKDGIYGSNTDILLQNVYNVKTICKNFNINDDKIYCRCKGKYCTGHPSIINITLLKYLQDLRTKSGFSFHISSFLRCKTWNKLQGGTTGSKHTKGKACDFYNILKTNTLEKRKVIINKWINNYSESNMGYCNGYRNRKGTKTYPSVKGMGISIHVDVK